MKVVGLVGLIVAVALLRMVPHPPNFTPILGMALFAGWVFPRREMAITIPLLAMLISDLFIGFSSISAVVYVSIAFASIMGRIIDRHAGKFVFSALASAVVFFLTTNFAVWASFGMYPKTLEGLIQCYVAGVPFFQNTLAGTFLSAGALFGGYLFVESRGLIARQTA